MVGVRDFGMEQQRVKLPVGAAIAATGAFALVAVTENPAAPLFTKSPWLAHTRRSAERSKQRRVGAISIVARPNSRCGAGATSPPSACVISCMP